MSAEYMEEIGLIHSSYDIREDGAGTLVKRRCESFVNEQDFDWVALDDDSIRMIPPDGAEAFENISASSILLHDAKECREGEPPLALYITEWLNNGKLEGGTEGGLVRTTYCAEAHPVTGPCPNDTECGPGFCDYFWCEGEEPEPCDLEQ